MNNKTKSILIFEKHNLKIFNENNRITQAAKAKKKDQDKDQKKLNCFGFVGGWLQFTDIWVAIR